MVRAVVDNATNVCPCRETKNVGAMQQCSGHRFTCLTMPHLSTVSVSECPSCQAVSHQEVTASFCVGQGRKESMCVGWGECVHACTGTTEGRGHPQLLFFRDYPTSFLKMALSLF